MFPAVLGSAALLGLVALSPASLGSYVILETPNQAVEVGTVYPVDIKVFAAEPINAIELELSFPSEKVDVFSVDRGRSVITLWTEEPVITDSRVSLRGGTFQRGFIGEHLIATIDLRAKETGQYPVTIENVRFVSGDGAGTEITPQINSQSKLTLFNFDETTSQQDIALVLTPKNRTDINDDGRVTLQDLSAFMSAWSNGSAIYDFSGDGRMTFRDFSILLSNLVL